MDDEKIIYIYDYILKNKLNHDNIKKFINKNNIKYTENNNGMFINLSILDEKYIELLYNYLNTNLNNINYERTNIIYNTKPIKINTQKKEKKYSKKQNLTEIELEIIKYSKII